MKWFTEAEIALAAGMAELSPAERKRVAESVARHYTSLVSRCILSGRFSELKSIARREEEFFSVKKAIRHWVDLNGAVFDPHQDRWGVLEARDIERLRKTADTD